MDRAKRLIFILLLVLQAGIPAYGQSIWPTPEVEQLYKEARDFHSRGNLREAIIRYQQAIQIAPDIVLLHRELAHTYYLAKGYNEAMATLDPIIKQQKADAETYKIMTDCLMAIGEEKKAKKLLRQGVEVLPNAGVLYHQMGLMYESSNEIVYALESWLDGIQRDPAYHLNYYEAARTYMNTNKIVWAIIYAEIFINIEQQTPRSYDTRRILLESYQKLFNTVATATVPKFGTAGNETGPMTFEQAVYDTYIKLSPVMSDGITTENLIMLRTRFLMDWTMLYAERFPHSLYSRHDELMRSGYFDMYNQWLFGKVENLQQYDAWMKFHENAMPKFENWLRQYPYRPLKSDFYNDKIVDGIFDK